MFGKKRSRWVSLSPMAVLVSVSLGVGGASASGAGPAHGDGSDPIGDLNGVHVISPTDVWAVGFGANQALAQHWDGTEWKTVLTPPVPIARLWAMDSFNSDDVWAVGFHEVDAQRVALVEHWDGSTWQVVDAPAPGYSSVLNKVSVVSADDVWAAGITDGTEYGDCLLEHWNGTDWQRVDCPHGGWANEGAGLFGLDMWSASQGWAVGYYHPTKGHYSPLIERWNGQEWRQVPAKKPSGRNLNTKLNSVVATGRGTTLATGYDVPTGGFVELRDHSAWHLDPLFPPSESSLYALSATSPTDIWAASRGPSVFHFDGSEWSHMSAKVPHSGEDNFGGMDAHSPTDIWAVGKHFVEHWDGKKWHIVDDS